jgi:sugar transferase (PEP-CTERM/EpsH1 system associated)
VRILYLCHRIPYPPNKGDKIRAFHQLRAMGERHEVDLFTLADDPDDAVHEAALAKYCRRVTVEQLNPTWSRLRSLPFLLTDTALTVPYFHSPKLDAAVGKALANRSYDRIFIYCSAMAQYVDGVDGIPIVTDLVDVDSDKWTQYAGFAPFPWSTVYRREGRCLREYERSVCARSWRVVVTTEREAALARQVTEHDRVHVIGNGVNTEYFAPADRWPDVAAPTVTFTGDMSYFPNETAVTFFAREVFPTVRQAVPTARFLIVGRKPGKNVKRLEELGGIEVTGFVPDMRAYLARTHVSVAPFSIAAGIQNKILESMAFGLPVVATSRTVRGLSREVAEIVDTADEPAAMAAAVVALLRDPDAARRKGLEGRARVAAVYDWDHWLGKLAELVESPVGEPRESRWSACFSDRRTGGATSRSSFTPGCT